MKIFYIIFILIVLVLIGSYYIFYKEKVDNKQSDILDMNEESINAIIETNFGEIKLNLFSSDTPKTVNNFIKLSKNDFYKGTKFHRIIKGFMIQGGDPLSKDDSLKDEWGTGGPGYMFEDEINKNNYNTVGTIAMANSGADTNGSQFFINTTDNNSLDGKHTVFGEVIEGMDNVRKIENVETEESDRPIESVVIENIKIVEK